MASYIPKIVFKYDGVDGKKHQKTINPSRKWGGVTAVCAIAIVAGVLVKLVR